MRFDKINISEIYSRCSFIAENACIKTAHPNAVTRKLINNIIRSIPELGTSTKPKIIAIKLITITKIKK